jgi:ferredoxin
MAMKVLAECINCAACEPECPNEAIARDEATDIYLVDAERCTECVGAHDAPRCVEVCPVDCIAPDPAHAETREELQAKYERLHAA